MIEPISQTIMNGLIIGLLTGIVYSLSKKLYYIIWGLAVGTLIILVIFFSGGSEISNTWGIWNWITMLIAVNIGNLLGRFGMDELKNVFKK